MKNSFYLVIPEQEKNKELLASYERMAVNQWVSSLPAANLNLAARLFYDFVEKFNGLDIPAQQRLDVLELLRPHFLNIKSSFYSQLSRSGFPKGQEDQKTFDLLVSIERSYVIGYWLVVRELTHRDIGWFKGKSAALAIQRTIKGLSEIIITYHMMFLPVPDWVWIDLHSLYKLSAKIKKDTTKVPDEENFFGKVTSSESSYIQILLFSLSGPSGLMQREMQQVVDLIKRISHYVSIERQPVREQESQCVVFVDEDRKPYFSARDYGGGSSKIFLNLTKLRVALNQPNKFSSEQQSRFGELDLSVIKSKKIPSELLDYLLKHWSGNGLNGIPLFSDRLDRYIAVGLGATHSLQSFAKIKHEILAKSFSERELSCQFSKENILSIGSLVSFRQITAPEHKRYLGVVKKLSVPKLNGQIVFELEQLTHRAYAVSYLNIDSNLKSERQKALLYRIQDGSKEKTYILMDSIIYKKGDIMRLFMNEKDFPIVLGGQKNIGFGYWQFECRRIEEKKACQSRKK